MVIVETNKRWLGNDQLGTPLRIRKVEQVKGKYGPEIELTLADEYDMEFRTGCFGENLNFMVYNFGRESDAWLERMIKVDKVEREWKDGTKTLKLFSLP